MRSTSFASGSSNVFTSSFTARVDRCSAVIRSRVDGDPENGVHEYSHDGTNSMIVVCHPEGVATNVTQLNNGVLTETILDPPQRTKAQANAYLRRDMLPPYGFEHITAVWLAYGSQCYYRQAGAEVSPAVSVARGYRESGRKVKSAWRFNEAPPGLLSYMTEFLPSDEPALGLVSAATRDTTTAQKTYFTNALFQATSLTNVAGLTLPMKFEMVKFAPDLPGRHPKALYRCDGTVTRIDAPAGPPLAPAMEPTRFTWRE